MKSLSQDSSFNICDTWRGFAGLDGWVEAIIQQKRDVYPRFCFPSRSYIDEYVSNIRSYSDEQVISLLRELLIPYTTGTAFELLHFYESVTPYDDHYEFIQKVLNNGNYVRLRKGEKEWEGLTWILQFLPHRPLNAINVLNNYFSAECGYMHDHRINGIDECIRIIEEKFINQTSGKENFLYTLKPREFEVLIKKLYKAMGYDAILTPVTRDGGKDIVATIKRTDGAENVYVECKLYKTTRLKPENVNALAGLITRDCINRGVIFCTGVVSDKLKEIDSRIEVISLEGIILLLNMHLGSNWNETL